MDKSTLSNYGWIVIAVLVLAVMIALATPFGTYVKTGVENTTQGLFDTSEKALNVVGMSAGDGSFESGSGSSATKDPALNPNGIIPNEATYTQNGIIYNSEQEFPTIANGDIYVFNDYKYTYNQSYGGWSVNVLDKTKTKYSDILETINNQPVNRLLSTFWGCQNITTTPKLPDTIIHMSNTFENCPMLTTITNIPQNIKSMTSAFGSCPKLVNVPSFDNCSQLISMLYTFQDCTGLIEKPTIPNTVETPENEIFQGCTQFGY